MGHTFYPTSAERSRASRFVAAAAVIGLGMHNTTSANAQFVSFVSGNGSANSLTTDTNGTISASNGVSAVYSNTGPTIGRPYPNLTTFDS